MNGWWAWVPLSLSSLQGTEGRNVLPERPSLPRQRTIALVGTWGLSGSVREETRIFSKRKSTQTTTEVACNACPTLTFRPDHTGFYVLPSGTTEAFTWTAAAGILRFRNGPSDRAKGLSPAIEDGSYAVISRTAETVGDEIRLVRQKSRASKNGHIVDTYVLAKQP
ncbi:hypothetical protein [Hymenobacter aerophilus]|uniref:hypothetical protein n=1 Tax=Hymenobacter aerophilus TaxID=119644 RepID=UPI00036ACA4D|nr:hypothetical protein [Hymenobacter aerophilus]